MKILSNKAKQFLVLLIKIVVVSGAFYFIYHQLSSDTSLNIPLLMEIAVQKEHWGTLITLFILTLANRFFEILKWKNLGSLIRPISLWESTQQVLTALTLGIFTPAGVGEYAGKALYFDKSQTSKVIFLNMICNGVQVLYAILFGLMGVTFLNQYFPIVSNHTLAYVFLAILTILVVVMSFRNRTIKGYSLRWVWEQLQLIPKKVHRKNMFFALCRYLVFTHQYIILYRLFGVDLPYWELLFAISAIYLLASSIPNFQFLEFAVKGSIAIYIFSILGVNQWIVALVATLIWLLNIVFPVSIGSIFVLRFKWKH